MNFGIKRGYVTLGGEYLRCNKCGGLIKSEIRGAISIIKNPTCIDCKTKFPNWLIYYATNLIFDCKGNCIYEDKDGGCVLISNGIATKLLTIFCPVNVE